MPKWSKNAGAGTVDLRWSAGFGNTDGVRTDRSTGVNSVQTTIGVADTNPYLLGTSRIKTS